MGVSYISDDDMDDIKLTHGNSASSFSATSNFGGSSGTQSGLGPQSSSSTSLPHSKPQTCCLMDEGKKCNRFAGNASYSKRIQKNVFYKKLRLEFDPHSSHIYICDHHKVVIQSARARLRRDSDDEDGEDSPDVDLYQLQVSTLRRLKKHLKVSTKPGLNKAQLAETLTKHFKNIPVNEKEILTYFIYTVKTDKNKLDSNSKQESGNGATQGDFSYDRY